MTPYNIIENIRNYGRTCLPIVDDLNFNYLKKYMFGQVWWLTPVIPALWQAKVSRSRGKEIKTILANIVKPCLY